MFVYLVVLKNGLLFFFLYPKMRRDDDDSTGWFFEAGNTGEVVERVHTYVRDKITS